MTQETVNPVKGETSNSPSCHSLLFSNKLIQRGLVQGSLFHYTEFPREACCFWIVQYEFNIKKKSHVQIIVRK